MKKLLVLTVFMFTTAVVFAQVKFGVKGGLNLAHISSNDAEINKDKKMMPSFHLGGVIDIPIGPNFSFQPNLLLMGKGTGIVHNDHTDKIKITALDLPLNAVYRSKGGFFAGAGPNLGFNFSAKEKHHDDIDNIGIGKKPGEIKGFDFGVNVLAGFQAPSGFFVTVNYLKGLSNLVNTPNDEWNNNILGVSAGMMLGKGKKGK